MSSSHLTGRGRGQAVRRRAVHSISLSAYTVLSPAITELEDRVRPGARENEDDEQYERQNDEGPALKPGDNEFAVSRHGAQCARYLPR